MLSEWVYRRMLLVYPREHRREYEEPMVQLFRDRMRRDGGGFGRLIVWTQMVLDLVGAAFKEHKEGADVRKLASIGTALAVVLVAGGIGIGTLLASPDDGPRVSVSWQDAEGVDIEEPDGGPKVSVSWQDADGIVVGEPGDGPRVSVSWQDAEGVDIEEPDGGPKVSVSWQDADGGATP